MSYTIHCVGCIPPGIGNRIPRTETSPRKTTESYRNSCYRLFAVQLPDANCKFQDVIKTWGLGPPKIPPTCPMRLGTFNELPTLKPLKYKNFVSSISAKRSCLECIPNNWFPM